MLEGFPGDFDLRMHSSIIEREVGGEVKTMWETKNDDRRGGGVDSAEYCNG